MHFLCFSPSLLLALSLVYYFLVCFISHFLFWSKMVFFPYSLRDFYFVFSSPYVFLCMSFQTFFLEVCRFPIVTGNCVISFTNLSLPNEDYHNNNKNKATNNEHLQNCSCKRSSNLNPFCINEHTLSLWHTDRLFFKHIHRELNESILAHTHNESLTVPC